METIIVPARFRGPPHSGNGGYVAGLLAKHVGGPRAVMMRAPVPLDTSLELDRTSEPARLLRDGAVIAEANRADAAALPEAPPAPTLYAAGAAAGRAVCYHPICFCCGDRLSPDEGLRVQTGQLAEAPAGHVAGVWTVDPAFVEADEQVGEEHVWAAIDCPGYYAWVALEGRHGALTGTMQAEVLERPRVGETCIVLAWPIARLSDRRRSSGVALFGADGRLMARAWQVWITPNRLLPPAPT